MRDRWKRAEGWKEREERPLMADAKWERERERERTKVVLKKYEYEYLNKMKCRVNDWCGYFVKVVV